VLEPVQTYDVMMHREMSQRMAKYLSRRAEQNACAMYIYSNPACQPESGGIKNDSHLHDHLSTAASRLLCLVPSSLPLPEVPA